MRRTLTASMLLVGIGLLVGCSGEKTSGQALAEQPPTSSAPAAGGSPTEPCALLPGESVGEHLDMNEVTATPLPEETAEDEAKIYLCQYTSDGLPVGALTVSVYQDNELDAQTLIDVIEVDYTASQDIPGVGEAAATFEDKDGRYLASAKVVSSTQVMVMWVGSKDLSAEQLTAMVKPVMDRL